MHRIVAGLCGLLFLAQTFAAAPADPKPADNAAAAAEAEEERESQKLLKSIQWTRGPGEAEVGKYARVKVPEGYWFTAGDGTRKLLEAMGNPTNGSELGFLSPTNLNWSLSLNFRTSVT
jgi:uncharacterized membrane-anchored protein